MNLISFQDSTVETVILISPKFGVSQISSLRNTVVSNIFQFYPFTSEDGVIQKVKKPMLSILTEKARNIRETTIDGCSPHREPADFLLIYSSLNLKTWNPIWCKISILYLY